MDDFETIIDDEGVLGSRGFFKGDALESNRLCKRIAEYGRFSQEVTTLPKFMGHVYRMCIEALNEKTGSS